MKKTAVEQKADLLDSFIKKTTPRTLQRNFVHVKRDYTKITPDLTYTEDPFIDEITGFSTRTVNLLRKMYSDYGPKKGAKKVNELQLSDIVPISNEIWNVPGAGKKAAEELTYVLSRYPNLQF